MKLFRLIRSIVFSIRTKNIGKRVKVLGKCCLRANPKIILGKNVVIYPNVIFWGSGTIKIGDNCMIGDNVILFCQKSGGIEIGNNTLIAANCYIIDSNHGTSKNDLIMNQPLISKKIFIGDDVWICSSCTIIGGVSLGKGSVVGANSMVNKDVLEYNIVGGVPAKYLKERQINE